MITSHNRWIVRKERDPYGSKETPWFAEPERHWETGLTAFRTHAEALAYADRMARTVENALPRVTSACDPIPNSPKPPEHSIWYGSRRDGAYWLHVPHGMSAPLIVGQEELAPLALALLALHHRNQP